MLNDKNHVKFVGEFTFFVAGLVMAFFGAMQGITWIVILGIFIVLVGAICLYQYLNGD